MGYNASKIIKNQPPNKKDYVEWSDGVSRVPIKRIESFLQTMQQHHMSIAYIQKVDYSNKNGYEFLVTSSPIIREGSSGWEVTQELLKQILDDYETQDS